MIEKIRKIGIFTKGIIYFLVGLLTLLAALDFGGKISGINEVIRFLKEQPFGKIILILLAIGLLMYTLWKLYTAFFDAKNKGSNKTGIVKRMGFFINGTIFGTLSFSILFNLLGQNSDTNTKKFAVRYLIQSETGLILLYIVAIILFCVGVSLIHKGIKNKFLEDIKQDKKIESKHVLEKTGKFGHISIGISYFIFAFFVYLATQNKNAQEIKNLEGVFIFLRSFTLGNFFMGLMALGFLCYGIYQYFLARYSNQY